MSKTQTQAATSAAPAPQAAPATPAAPTSGPPGGGRWVWGATGWQPLPDTPPNTPDESLE